MTDAHRRELREAAHRMKPIRRAIGLAKTSAWSLGVFAAITLISAIWSLPALIPGAVLTWLTVQEFRGVHMIRRFDLRGPRHLALNQIALAVAIVVYSGWHLWLSLNDSGVEALRALGDPATERMVRDLYRSISVSVYATLGIVGPIFPLLTAWYYASRRKCIEAMIHQTPGWAIDAIHAAA